MIKKIAIILMIAGLLCAGVTMAAPPDGKAAYREALKELKRSAGKKGVALHQLNREFREFKQVRGKKARDVDFRPRHNNLMVSDGLITVDAVAKPGHVDDLRRSLEQMGMQNIFIYKNVVSGRLPLAELDSVDSAMGLHLMRPAMARTNVGLVDSQGDVSMQSKTAKAQFGVTGAGQTVGVLSDSFNAAAFGCADALDPGVRMTTAEEDVASGDLPVVDVVEEIFECGSVDEGRGMAQHIYDVAPGADISFHSAFNGYASFAQGIIDLADAGASVIVDDVFYFAEPMFMDGLIAQAVDEVNERGIPYFSSAGNSAYDSYESEFRDSGTISFFGGLLHDFDPGAGVDTAQQITVNPGITQIIFQWDEPFFTDTNGAAASANDLDVFLYDSTGFPCIVFPIPFPGCEGGDVIQAFGVDANLNGDPVEIFLIGNFTDGPVTLDLTLEVFAGTLPGYLKYVYLDPMTVDEYATMSGASFGKAMANGAFGTGASAWFNTRAFNPRCGSCDPARINGFSSAGGTPILFDTQGNRLATPEIRQKPNATGPDGADNTFFGFRLGFKTPRDARQYPNFFGTSASAPHVAAVAALMLETSPWLDADDVFAILEATADDMDDVRTPDPDVGFDFGTGHGFVNAEKALAAARGDICHNGQTITVKNSGAVSAHVAHGDQLGACE
jgi:subtilisin family serine protease